MPMPAHPAPAQSRSENPSCWIGCLACYNAGRLVGDWFAALDCPQDMPTFEAATAAFLPWLHLAEGHEELHVFDVDDFGGVLNDECSPSHAAHLACLIRDANDRGLPVDAVAYWVNDGNDTSDSASLLDDLQDAYCGEYDSGADYAQQLAEDIGAIPESLPWPLSCVDWAAAWRELELGGDCFAIASNCGGVHIFRAI